MNCNSITLLILSTLLLLAAMPFSVARYLPADYAKRKPSRSLHWKRVADYSWDVHDTSRGQYICNVTKSSPLKSDVEDAAAELGRRARKAICTWDPLHECITVATQDSAEIGICNIWNGGMPCRAVGKVVSRITAKCAHRFWGDLERAGGKAVFDWGTIVVF